MFVLRYNKNNICALYCTMMRYKNQEIGEKMMENLNHNIAENLKRIRNERSLSLTQLAELTGISKSMLGQIEREETNPTISTIWKISTGLKVALTELIETSLPSKMLITKDDIIPFYEDEQKVYSYPFFRNNQGKNFEMMQVFLEPKGKLSSLAHIHGTKEYIIVFSGELSITIDHEVHKILAGQAFQFDADKDHIYENQSTETVSLCMLIFYS